MDPFASPNAQTDYVIRIADSVEVPVIAFIRSEIMTITDILCIAKNDNIIGVRFATMNLILLAQCVNETSSSEIAWMCGIAEGWAPPFYSVGARGFTSEFVNVNP